ncbi:MAG TPA: polyphenol oxidase family protein [Solirubrobacteraceae bacterium]|jgi:YfiH family protein|nr:polyphenol oxidase family protein [Solirubrobacteraceae bacterium]
MSAAQSGELATELFELPGGGLATFTGRAQGNMSSVGGEGAEHGLEARERLRKTLGVRRLVRGYQVHGTVVGRVLADGARAGLDSGERPAHPHVEVQAPVAGQQVDAFEREDSASQPAFEADGHAIAAPGLAAMVLTADCVPVVLGAQGAVAALHAGWRGLAGGVLEEGVRALREVGGRGDVVAVVGPCAGACCYEVGGEVHSAFAGAHRDGGTIDLRAIAHEKLLEAGVGQVFDFEACTICDERFFSHRREGLRAGRQAGLAWIAQ